MSRTIPLTVLRPRNTARTGALAAQGAASGEAKEKCGVFGVWGRADGVRLTYLGMYAQQHRGQESAGMAV